MRSITAFVGLAGLSLATTAFAGTTQFDGWNFSVAMGTGDSVWSALDHPETWSIRQIGGGTGDAPAMYRVTGAATIANNFSVSWELDLDPDPFVSAFFTVQNLTGNLQPFTITTSLPTISLGGPTTMFGSTTGTVGDGDFVQDQFGNGATVRTLVGSPYYEALVDGVGVRQLYPDAQSNSTPLGLVNAIPAINFSGVAGPALVSNIGIRNRFELTPGDNASFTSTFNIIPTPGAAALLSVAGFAMGRRRR